MPMGPLEVNAIGKRNRSSSFAAPAAVSIKDISIRETDHGDTAGRPSIPTKTAGPNTALFPSREELWRGVERRRSDFMRDTAPRRSAEAFDHNGHELM